MRPNKKKLREERKALKEKNRQTTIDYYMKNRIPFYDDKKKQLVMPLITDKDGKLQSSTVVRLDQKLLQKSVGKKRK